MTTPPKTPPHRRHAGLWTPVLLALQQITERSLFGVVLHSVLWSCVSFALLSAGVAYEMQLLAAGHGWWSWLAGALGAFATIVLSLWLFLPLATMIASLFLERIAQAVERRYYPALPPGHPANAVQQIQDSLLLGGRILAMQAVALVVTLIPPHITGLAFGWLIASWAVGRGLFMPVAMRRMERKTALALYRAMRGRVVLHGAWISAAGLVPGLNLFAPVLGTAAMVHLLHIAMAEMGMMGERVVPPAMGVLGGKAHRSSS